MSASDSRAVGSTSSTGRTDPPGRTSASKRRHAPESWDGARVVVVGAGHSGIAVAELLATLGAQVHLTDRRHAEELVGASALDELVRSGVRLELGGHPESLWEADTTVVASPGIPPTAPPLAAATAAGSPILSEIEVAAALAQAPAVAITGSNGKSTVTTMVSAILRAAGLDAPAGGNLGVPFSRLVREELAGRVVDRFVLELSSFQTESVVDFKPRWMGMLNLSDDHLDRHGTFENYAAAKLRLLDNVDAGDWIVFGADDAPLSQLVAQRAGVPGMDPGRVGFGERRPSTAAAAWVERGWLLWQAPGSQPVEVLATDELRIVGSHNQLNACAAIGLACLAGATPDAAAEALRSFAGLEHRMEVCAEISGVLCINDSKATNVGATVAALSGLQAPIWLILGGRDKNSDFNLLRPLMRDRVRGALLIGEASGRIAASLQGAVPLQICGNLSTAFERGLDAAASGHVLLLAPACTSFDQYDSFEHRGRHFKELVDRASSSTTDHGEAARN